MSNIPTNTRTFHRSLVLVLAPAAVLGLALFVLMWGTFQRDLAAADDRLARSTVQRIALESRESIKAGDTATLARIAQNCLREPGILSVTVEDASGNRLVHAMAESDAGATSWFWRRLEHSVPPAVYTARVQASGGPLAGAADSSLGGHGQVVLQVSRAPSVARQLTVLGLASLASLIVLGTAAVAAMRRRRERTLRLAELLDTLRDYEMGVFETRVPEGSTGTLGKIEKCINQVAEGMGRLQQDLQIQVDRATRELRQTLEEVEVKNVQLDLARKRAVGASQAKSEFLANMSHEIRTPMNAIVGYTQLLARTSPDADQRGYLETIQGAADSLLGIIDDILNLSRLEAGKFVVQERAFSVRDCVNQLIELLAPSAFRKGLDFYRIVDHRVPNTVIGDPLRIRQILTNLISNAIKFTPAGQVSVLVNVIRADTPEQELVFTVLDTGLGIPDEDRARVFQPFARGEDADHEITGGTGLGLTISKRLCEAMMGRIQARSTSGEGSCFTVTLPLKTVEGTVAVTPPILDGLATLVYAQDQRFCAWLLEWLEQRGAIASATRSLRELSDAHQRLSSQTGTPADAVLAVMGVEELSAGVDLRTRWKEQCPMPPLVMLMSSQDRAELKALASRQDGVVLPACAEETVIEDALLAAVGRAPGERVEPSVNIGSVERPPAREAGTTRLTVLIAEDNEINSRYLTKILDLHGIASECCDNGETAVTMATGGRFDAVLMDIRMPRMDGVEATRRIREALESRRLPIIGLTASALPEERLRYMSQGLDECLVKPVKPAMLVAMIQRLVDSDRAGTEPDSDSDSTLDPELLALLREELPGRVERMVAARQAGDYASLRGEVHKINGAAAVLRLHDLWRAAGTLESRLVAGDTARIDEPLDALVTQVESILA